MALSKLLAFTVLFIFMTSTQIFGQNTPPEFIGPPNEITMDQDSEYYLAVWDFVQDAETPNEELTYEFNSSEPSIELFFDNSIGELTITATNGFSGNADLEITVYDPDFEQAFTVITIIVEAVNTPPEFINAPNEITMDQDSEYYLAIWDFVQDAETSNDGLEYEFSSSEQSIGLFYDNSIGELTISATNGFSGNTDLEITVTDPQFEQAFTTITLIVEAVNTPPEFINAPMQINMDQNSEYYLAIWDIVQDAETSNDGLDYQFSSSEPSIELFYDNSIGELTITATNGFSGNADLDITVSDPQLEQASIIITIIVDAVNTPPEFVNAPSQITMDQDTEYYFDIWDIVQDAETSNDGLDYQFASSEPSVQLNYDDSIGELTITATNGFSGNADLEITVSDPEFDQAFLIITLIVEAFNSAPEFVNAPTEIYFTEGTEYELNVWEIVQDAETSDDALDYLFASNNDSIGLDYNNATGVLTITSNNYFYGITDFNITVSDPQLEQAFISIILNIEADHTHLNFVDLPDSLFLESDSPYVINIWPFVEDTRFPDVDLNYIFLVNQGLITLSYTASTGDLEINPNGFLGTALVQIQVEDNHGASISGSIVLDIQLANTAPEFVNVPTEISFNQIIEYYLNVWDIVQDAETSDDALDYLFSSTNDSIELSYNNATGILTVSSLNYFYGITDLNITVTDPQLEQASITIPLNLELDLTHLNFVDLPDTIRLVLDSPYVINIWPFVENTRFPDVDLDFVFLVNEGSITLSYTASTGDLEINPNGFSGIASLQIQVEDEHGASVSADVVLDIDLATSIANNDNAKSFSLSQNYPNPFNPSTQISYQLAQNSAVILKVFDVSGREKATLVDGRQSAGNYTVFYDAASLPSGIYFYRLTTSKGFAETRRMMLIK